MLPEVEVYLGQVFISILSIGPTVKVDLIIGSGKGIWFRK